MRPLTRRITFCDFTFRNIVKYECSVVHIPLASLELLCNDDTPANPRDYHTLALQQRRPFQLLTEITSRSRIGNMVVDENVLGGPFVAVLKTPDRIVYKNLNGGLATTMYCSAHPSYQELVRALP